MAQKKRGTISLIISIEASPNALNAINSPLPRLIGYRYPLVGERIYDKHERLLTALPAFERLAIFDRRIKQKTLPKMSRINARGDYPTQSYTNKYDLQKKMVENKF